jgi:hypothetical protein
MKPPPMPSRTVRILQHQCADRPEQGDVKQSDHDIDLAARLRQPEQAGPGKTADEAAGDHHQPHPEVDAAALQMGQHARHAGAGDLGGRRSDGDAWRNAVEDQQWRGQEPATDPEQPGQHAHQSAKRHDEQRVDAHVGDGKVDVHEAAGSDS